MSSRQRTPPATSNIGFDFCAAYIRSFAITSLEWSKWDEYAVLGSRRMDCIGGVVTRPSDWEYRESTT
jgi:hypothetical protein